jgi:uncharacterized protein YutE (UPF0331/DUF86 family)
MPTEPDDVCLNKAAIIERAIGRAFEEFAFDPRLENYTHIVATERLGMPQTSSDAFRLLQKAGHIGTDTVRDMIAMTGFRNIAVHEYQALDLAILRAIVESRWRSLVVYCRELGIRIDPRSPGTAGLPGKSARQQAEG